MTCEEKHAWAETKTVYSLVQDLRDDDVRNDAGELQLGAGRSTVAAVAQWYHAAADRHVDRCRGHLPRES